MLIAFVFSFKVSEWIVTVGYFNSFMIYTGLMAGFALLLPVVWYVFFLHRCIACGGCEQFFV